MKYLTILNGKEKELEIIQQDEFFYQVTLDGHNHQLDARFCSPDLVSILINHRSHDISYSIDRDHVHLSFRNRHFDIEVLNERRLRMRGLGTNLQSSGPEYIKTSIPGKVSKVLVEEGQHVTSGTDIIIIEAMKMENQIRCRNSGTIGNIHVKTGDIVKANVVLVEIFPLLTT